MDTKEKLESLSGKLSKLRAGILKEVPKALQAVEDDDVYNELVGRINSTLDNDMKNSQQDAEHCDACRDGFESDIDRAQELINKYLAGDIHRVEQALCASYFDPTNNSGSTLVFLVQKGRLAALGDNKLGESVSALMEQPIKDVGAVDLPEAVNFRNQTYELQGSQVIKMFDYEIEAY